MNKRDILDYVVWTVCAVLIVVILVVIPSLERDPKERGTMEAVTEAKTELKTEQATEAVEIVQTEPPEEVKRAELARLERKKDRTGNGAHNGRSERGRVRMDRTQI